MHFLPMFRATLLALVLVLPLAAFEGKVHFDIISGRDKHQMVYWLKGDKARVEMPQAEGASMIIDGKSQQMLMLMPEEKMYMVMPMKAAVEKAQKKAVEVKFEDTGETETILGRQTRKYRVTERNSTSEIWAAQGMGTFMGQLGGNNPMKGGPAMPEWQRELMDKGMFPLRMVVLDRKGKESMRMQATKIDETRIADADLSVPAGYQKFDMGGMLKGMLPGAK